mgnify:CR=1 FL=1
MVVSCRDSVLERRFCGILDAVLAGLMFGQIGIHMTPCDGGYAFCAFAKPHTTRIEPGRLS